MFLLECSWITATANREYRPNLGPSCSYWDVAALLFTESKEDKPAIKKNRKVTQYLLSWGTNCDAVA
jgi:hypothetical protein